jgi:hypothetical protein
MFPIINGKKLNGISNSIYGIKIDNIMKNKPIINIAINNDANSLDCRLNSVFSSIFSGFIKLFIN